MTANTAGTTEQPAREKTGTGPPRGIARALGRTQKTGNGRRTAISENSGTTTKAGTAEIASKDTAGTTGQRGTMKSLLPLPQTTRGASQPAAHGNTSKCKNVSVLR